MKKLLIGLLFLHMNISADVIESYGVIKPIKALPGVGIIHLREKEGLEVEGYLSSMKGKNPVVFSVWTTEVVNKSPICVGACLSDQLSGTTVLPARQILQLGELAPNQEGYGELSLKFDQMSLRDLNDPSLRILVYPKDEKVHALSNNLIEQQFSMIELRWIEN